MIKKMKKGFTLAEVLITLMIIGVVAAVTIPTLMNNINNNAMANQRKTVSAKIAEGFNQMRVAGALATTYDDTTAFVNEMKKYFKINSVCKSTELTNCFNSTVTTANGEETNEIANMDGVNDVVGLILSDGTSMLIKYDKTADKIEEGQIEKVGYVNDAKGNLQYATYGDLIKYIYDVNGNKSPNKSGTDIMGNLSIVPDKTISCNDETCVATFPNGVVMSCVCFDNDIEHCMGCSVQNLPYGVSCSSCNINGICNECQYQGEINGKNRDCQDCNFNGTGITCNHTCTCVDEMIPHTGCNMQCEECSN